MTGMIKVDDIITEYEATKRKQGFCVCYDPKEDKVFSSKKETAATVIITDTQELCFKIMKQYIEEPAIAPYSTECRTKMKNTSNKIVSFCSRDCEELCSNSAGCKRSNTDGQILLPRRNTEW